MQRWPGVRAEGCYLGEGSTAPKEGGPFCLEVKILTSNVKEKGLPAYSLLGRLLSCSFTATTKKTIVNARRISKFRETGYRLVPPKLYLARSVK